jgi:hypothetical protein
MDNEIDRLTLITSGVTMRGRHVGFHTQNPRNPARQRPDHLGVYCSYSNMFEQHWHRTPPLFVLIVHRHLIHSHIHFHSFSPVFFVYYYRKINCATLLH